MTLLVADVGGTNTRIAQFAPTAEILQVERFRNDDFPTFDAVLVRYLTGRDLPPLAGCSVAIAGPIGDGTARLTNRDWYFDPRAIADRLALAPGARVHLVNDLAALGHALPGLSPAQISSVRAANGTTAQNRQSVVVGLGTGFNACVVNARATPPLVNEAELGHASLAASVDGVLTAGLGPKAAGFRTNEDLFSGDGLTRLYQILSDGGAVAGPQIMAAYVAGQDTAARSSVDLFARALGVAARELVFQYLPYGGIHYAGGVARGLFASPAKALFLAAFTAPGPFDNHFAMVPVRVITDDAAALIGAGNYALCAGG